TDLRGWVRTEVEGQDTAGRVRDEEPTSGNRDAIGTGPVVIRHKPSRGVGPRLEGDTGERRRRLDLPHEWIRPRVDDIDTGVGTIGEIVKLGVLGDEADIERPEWTKRSGDRNGCEQLDRPVVVVCPAQSWSDQ